MSLDSNAVFFLTAIQCPALPGIDNAIISYNSVGTDSFFFNTAATHICDNGYFLSDGSNMRVCGGVDSSTAGMWSGTAPTCTGESLLLVSMIATYHSVLL